MIRATLNYTRQNAIAFLALFVALSGTAFAATKLPNNSVGTKQIKKSAVTGVKVKKNTLTGTQINESKLKRVPDSSRLGGKLASSYLTDAGTAANASKFGGIDPSVFGTALTVAGSTFNLRDTTGTARKGYGTTGSIYSGTSAGEFQLAVQLPQGARITSLDYRAIDNEAVVNSSLALLAYNSVGANGIDSDTLVTASSTDADGDRRNFTATPTSTKIIDNSKWSYVLAWTPYTFGGNMQLVGGRINYVLPAN
jgi:hypothetical protein